MFTDLILARRNALNLSKTLMVATLVIATGAHYSVITAEDHDSALVVIAEFDPFA